VSTTHQYLIAALLPGSPPLYWTGHEWADLAPAALKWNYPNRAMSASRTLPPVQGREIIVKAA